MSEDADTPPAATTAAPEAISGYSQQGRRTLIVTIGRLAANFAKLILAGAGLAVVSLRVWLVRTYGRQGPVWVAGLALIVVGILCLSLSGVVVTGWWQDTLDAFGVGFVVGGIVDVLAISGLNQIVAERQKISEEVQAGEQRRRQASQQADFLLRETGDLFGNAVEARRLLSQSRDDIGPWLAAGLEELIERANAPGREEWRRVHGGDPPASGTAEPVNGETS
jgi:hypothetical protein